MMVNQIKIEAREFYEKKQYAKAIKVGLNQIKKNNFKSDKDFSIYFFNLVYSLYSSTESDILSFKDFLDIFPKYLSIVEKIRQNEPPTGFYNNALLFQNYVRATIFGHYFSDISLKKVVDSASLLRYWSSKVSESNELNSNLLKLIDLIEKGKHPYFNVNFRIPFALPLPDGEYHIGEVEGFNNVKSIKLKTKNIPDLTSAVGDRFFSEVDIKVIGYTVASNYWKGPSIVSNQKSFNLSICLKVINRIILQIKLLNSSVRVKMINHGDIGRSITTQYNGNDEDLNQSINLSFGGDSSVDILKKQSLSIDEEQSLINKLKDHDLELYEELFAESLIDFSNENYKGAFYLLNSALEALIGSILYKTSKVGLKQELLKSSLFQQIKFLKDQNIISNEEFKESKKFLGKIRRDKLRNDLIHGRINKIEHNDILESIERYKDLEKIFISKIN